MMSQIKLTEMKYFDALEPEEEFFGLKLKND